MSRLCCDDDESKAGGEQKQHDRESLYVISDEEIQKVIEEAVSEKSEKPSTNDLHERIEDLEFELECLRADANEQQKKKAALLRLLGVIDLNRFENKNRVYVSAIVKKIKQIILS